MSDDDESQYEALGKAVKHPGPVTDHYVVLKGRVGSVTGITQGQGLSIGDIVWQGRWFFTDNEDVINDFLYVCHRVSEDPRAVPMPVFPKPTPSLVPNTAAPGEPAAPEAEDEAQGAEEPGPDREVPGQGDLFTLSRSVASFVRHDPSASPASCVSGTSPTGSPRSLYDEPAVVDVPVSPSLVPLLAPPGVNVLPKVDISDPGEPVRFVGSTKRQTLRSHFEHHLGLIIRRRCELQGFTIPSVTTATVSAPASAPVLSDARAPEGGDLMLRQPVSSLGNDARRVLTALFDDVEESSTGKAVPARVTSWHGEFRILRKKRGPRKAGEAFHLRFSPDTDAEALPAHALARAGSSGSTSRYYDVLGDGDNDFGTFAIYGRYDAMTQMLFCERHYTTLHRRRRRPSQSAHFAQQFLTPPGGARPDGGSATVNGRRVSRRKRASSNRLSEEPGKGGAGAPAGGSTPAASPGGSGKRKGGGDTGGASGGSGTGRRKGSTSGGGPKASPRGSPSSSSSGRKRSRSGSGRANANRRSGSASSATAAGAHAKDPARAAAAAAVAAAGAGGGLSLQENGAVQAGGAAGGHVSTAALRAGTAPSTYAELQAMVESARQSGGGDLQQVIQAAARAGLGVWVEQILAGRGGALGISPETGAGDGDATDPTHTAVATDAIDTAAHGGADAGAGSAARLTDSVIRLRAKAKVLGLVRALGPQHVYPYPLPHADAASRGLSGRQRRRQSAPRNGATAEATPVTAAQAAGVRSASDQLPAIQYGVPAHSHVPGASLERPAVVGQGLHPGVLRAPSPQVKGDQSEADQRIAGLGLRIQRPDDLAAAAAAASGGGSSSGVSGGGGAVSAVATASPAAASVGSRGGGGDTESAVTAPGTTEWGRVIGALRDACTLPWCHQEMFGATYPVLSGPRVAPRATCRRAPPTTSQQGAEGTVTPGAPGVASLDTATARGGPPATQGLDTRPDCKREPQQQDPKEEERAEGNEEQGAAGGVAPVLRVAYASLFPASIPSGETSSLRLPKLSEGAGLLTAPALSPLLARSAAEGGAGRSGSRPQTPTDSPLTPRSPEATPPSSPMRVRSPSLAEGRVPVFIGAEDAESVFDADGVGTEAGEGEEESQEVAAEADLAPGDLAAAASAKALALAGEGCTLAGISEWLAAVDTATANGVDLEGEDAQRALSTAMAAVVRSSRPHLRLRARQVRNGTTERGTARPGADARRGGMEEEEEEEEPEYDGESDEGGDEGEEGDAGVGSALLGGDRHNFGVGARKLVLELGRAAVFAGTHLGGGATTADGRTGWFPAHVVAQGEAFEGSYVNGLRHGHGAYVDAQGWMYEGGWKCGREHGWGVLSDGCCRVLYEGEYSEGVRCGRGTCFWASGDSYTGEWRDGLPHGTGRMVFASPDAAAELVDARRRSLAAVRRAVRAQQRSAVIAAARAAGQGRSTEAARAALRHVNRRSHRVRRRLQLEEDCVPDVPDTLLRAWAAEAAEEEEGVTAGDAEEAAPPAKRARSRTRSENGGSEVSAPGDDGASADGDGAPASPPGVEEEGDSEAADPVAVAVTACWHLLARARAWGRLSASAWSDAKEVLEAQAAAVGLSPRTIIRALDLDMGPCEEGEGEGADEPGVPMLWRGVYEGEWREGVRCGKGRLELDDGTTYEGEWLNNQFHGRGHLTRGDGLEYQGSFEHGRAEGKGECTFPGGPTYLGTWRAGMREGRGTLSFRNGSTYEGHFRDDQPGASGTLSLSGPAQSADGEWLVPLDFPSDFKRIHMKAGFTRVGR